MKVAELALVLAAAGPVLACSRTDSNREDSARVDRAATLPPPVADTAPTLSTSSFACIVTDSTIGAIRLGMTLAEAKAAMPPATFVRGFDGDGVASVGVALDGDTLVTVVADGDEAYAIAW